VSPGPAMKLGIADAFPRQQFAGPIVLYVNCVPAEPHPPALRGPPVPVAFSTWEW
jgi:hypothetical protein